MKIYFILNVFILSSIISFAQDSSVYKKSNSDLAIVNKDAVIGLSTDNQFTNWGYGVDLSLGYVLLSDDLSNNFKNFISYSMTWNFEYKKIAVLGVGYMYGASKTKEDIPITGGFWNKDSRANFNKLELFLGHNILNNKDLRILPIFGFASTYIKAKEPNAYDFNLEDELLDKNVHFNKSSYLFGVILDIKIRKNRSVPREYGVIRLRYSYYLTDFEKKYGMFNGNMHSLTIGIGGFIRKERKK